MIIRFIILIIFGFMAAFTSLTSYAASLPNYDVTLNDGVFDPAFIEVPAQTRIKISVSNIGKGPAEFENLSLRVEKVMSPGVSSFVVIHPLKPGNYHFIDEFHMDMSGFEIKVAEE